MLKGKNVLITGGSSGIGFGIACAIASQGANVMIWGRREENNINAKQLIKLETMNDKQIVETMKIDVTDEDAVNKGFQHSVKILGGYISAVFANAGGGSKPVEIQNMKTKQWRKVIQRNLDSTFFTFRAAAKHMIKRGGGGTLVATSSQAARIGDKYQTAYSAAKAGVIGLVRAMTSGLARYEIRCHCIIPGFILSGQFQEPDMEGYELHQQEKYGMMDAKKHPMRAIMKRLPLRKWGVPADFGGLAIYLVSDGSKYHTGDEFTIDGGYSRM